VWDFGNLTRINKEPSKKELAIAQSDGGCWEHCYTNTSNRWYFKQVSKTTRRVERTQAHKVYTAIDYDDVDYDDSEAVVKRKGVWWEIH